MPVWAAIASACRACAPCLSLCESRISSPVDTTVASTSSPTATRSLPSPSVSSARSIHASPLPPTSTNTLSAEIWMTRPFTICPISRTGRADSRANRVAKSSASLMLTTLGGGSREVKLIAAGSAERAREERQHVLSPDVHPAGAAEAMALLVLGHVGRIDLHGILLSPPLELGTDDAAGLETRVLRRLDQEHGNLGLAGGRDETFAERRVAVPALRTGRDRHGCAVASPALRREQGLDAAERAPRHHESLRIDIGLALQVGLSGELVVQMLALHEAHEKGRGPFPASQLVHD